MLGKAGLTCEGGACRQCGSWVRSSMRTRKNATQVDGRFNVITNLVPTFLHGAGLCMSQVGVVGTEKRNCVFKIGVLFASSAGAPNTPGYALRVEPRAAN